jgi:hypothetical protein
MSAANDGALVADVGAGEARAVANRAEAFGQLTDRQLDASFRLAALILGDRSEAEDVVHDALVSAWGQPRVKSVGKLGSTKVLVGTGGVLLF